MPFECRSLNESAEVATKEVSGGMPTSATAMVEVMGVSFWQLVQVSGGVVYGKLFQGFGCWMKS